nr:chloroplast 50S ribosomal protein L22 [Passiflora tenuiloba]
MLSLPLPVSSNAKSRWNFKNPTAFSPRVSPSNPGFSMASRVVIRPLAYSSSEIGLKKEGSTFGNITEAKLFKERATSRSKVCAVSGTEDGETKKKEGAIGEAYARTRYLRMSADKARLIIDQIRGRPYEEALMILELMPYRGCVPIFKLVYSAAANASNNLGLDKSSLVISKAFVDGGPVSKRFRPRARGRTSVIKKRTCHITVAVKDTSLSEQ